MSAFLALAFAMPILALDLAILLAGVLLVTGTVALVRARSRVKRLAQMRIQPV